MKDRNHRLQSPFQFVVATYTVTPNATVRTTFTLLYRSLEIDYGFTPHFLNPATGASVNSSLLVFNFRMYMGQWMQSLDFYRIKGFEVRDTNFSLPENFPPIFDHLNVLKIGGTTNYIFNKNFSFRAISFQNEWQRKSSGSFIPRLSYYFTRLKIDSPERDYFYDITLGPSYYYNWVIASHFIVSLGANAGMGFNISTNKNTTTKDETWAAINYSLGARLAIGYNSTHFFTGLNSNLDYFEHGSSDGVKIEDRQNLFEIYLGYRFKAPKKWNEAANKFNKKIGWD